MILRRLGYVFIALIVVVAGGAGWLYLHLQASLPRLEGTVRAPTLGAPVVVERDADGVPTVAAKTETDLAFAMGFVHAQERFFQMDLLRRAGAGELAGLLGPSIIEVDKRRRVHRLRARAERTWKGLGPEGRALLTAYADGVAAGLEDLGAPSFEYDLLGVEPEPWRPEDTFCVAYAMFFTLQDAFGADELRRQAIESVLAPDVAALVLSPGSRWDAALDGSATELLPVPAALAAPWTTGGAAEPEEAVEPGSNNWAVAGRLTTHGGAIVADDMHLALRMPNIWFRARQKLTGDRPLDITGVTLPGLPVVVAGSNGAIAWGFTNAYIDTSDVVVIEPGGAPDTYRTAGGDAPFEVFNETIEVRGAPSQTLVVKETVWGPIVGRDIEGRQVALRWVGHEPDACDLGLYEMSFARTLEDAIAAIHGAGMPNQNVMIAAADGRIAWTISGLVPLRPEGCEGLRPTSWAETQCAWTGFAASDAVPRVVDPPDGRLWTANNRILGPQTRGPTRYPNAALGARARQIRDGLFAKERFTEKDLLDIQLDDRAVFLEPWRDRLLERLDGDDALRAAVEAWGGRAAPDSVGYRVVKRFRKAVFDRLLDPLLAPVRDKVDAVDELQLRSLRPRNVEHLVEGVLSVEPLGVLPEGIESYDALLDDAVAAVRDEIDEEAGGDPANFTWGAANTLAIRHALSKAVPLIGRVIDPPAAPMPGDKNMPRVQSPVHGASERFVVSPGKEEQGFFHMPCGQASHPMSPYLHAGHDAWVEGRATPFLPGPTRWSLRFEPAG